MQSKPLSRYVAPSGPETDFQPGSRGRVMRNLPGVTRKREMDQLEFEALVRLRKWLTALHASTANCS